MTWKLTEKAMRVEPLPGVPWRDLSEHEFRQAAHAYALQGFPSNSLSRSGFFEHVREEGEPEPEPEDETPEPSAPAEEEG